MPGGIQNRGPSAPNTPQAPGVRHPAKPEVDAGDLNGRTVHVDEPAPAPRSRNSTQTAPPSHPITTASVEPAGGTARWGEKAKASSAARPRPETPRIGGTQIQRQQTGVSKKIADLEKHPDAQIDHLKQLQNDFRAHENAGRIQEARDTFSVLSERTDEYHSLFMELRFVKGLSKDLQRWKAPLPSALAKKLNQVEAELNGGRIAEARELLRSIKTDIQARHAPLRGQRDYKASDSTLRERYNGFATFAYKLGKHSSQLMLKLDAFDNAKQAARYNAKSSSAELKASLDRIESTGADLAETLAKEIDATANAANAKPADKALQMELQDLIYSTFGEVIERSHHVKPANLEQWRQHRAVKYKTSTHLHATVAIRKTQAANRLLSAGAARSNDKSARRPPKSDEVKYFGRLQAQYFRLHGLQVYGGHANKLKFSPEQFNVAVDLDAALRRLPGWDPNPVPGSDATNYTQALADLDRAGQLADTLVGLRSEALRRVINELDLIPTPEVRAKAAADAVREFTTGDPRLAVMGSIPQEEKIKLLEALRGGQKNSALSKDAQEAQSLVYKSIAIDGQFLQREKEIRAETIEALTTHDKQKLQRAQAEWPLLPNSAKLEIFKLVAGTYSKIAKCKVAPIFFDALSPGVAGFFRFRTGQIILNSNHPGLNDFDTAMDTIFHENSHNWQDDMINTLDSNPASMAKDPCLKQAQLFAANRDYYDNETEVKPASGKQAEVWTNPHLAYREQPMEAHAYLAGRKTARDLVRALNS